MFWPLRFVQSNTRTAAVLVDELDASAFESLPHKQPALTRSNPKIARSLHHHASSASKVEAK
jgi:hypothetical protein